MKKLLHHTFKKALQRYVAPLILKLKDQTLISKAARFAACEMIEGDYLEFGVYQGASFIKAYRSLKMQFESRIAQDIGGEDKQSAMKNRQKIWDQMRFFAFDSFEGLPKLTSEDSISGDFKQGQYACAVNDFKLHLKDQGVPADRSRIIKGWFSDTCVPETRSRHEMKKAAVVWIDGDLYSSAKSALSFITPLLQDGTIIIFDDWYSYKGSPYAGEQKAFWEWGSEITEEYSIQEYNKEDWKRASFIISKRIPPKGVEK